jgi:hypothetical protein
MLALLSPRKIIFPHHIPRISMLVPGFQSDSRLSARTLFPPIARLKSIHVSSVGLHAYPAHIL